MVKASKAPKHPTLCFYLVAGRHGCKKVLSGEFEMVSAVCGWPGLLPFLCHQAPPAPLPTALPRLSAG